MFEPKIIAFLCTWCSYTGADTAGIARMKSPANLRAIRVPCSGRVSPELIMRTFDQGADGVLVLGCHIGECHYDTGNHRAAKRIPILRSLMSFTGLEPERLRLDWVSASEGERFSRIATEFVDTVRALGPIHWKVNKEQLSFIKKQLLVVREGVPYIESDCSNKTDVIQAKAKELLSSGQVGVVIGYESGPRGWTRPVFVYSADETDRLVWNPSCTHNLVTYLPNKLKKIKGKEIPKPAAIVVKPCDSRAINVLLAESQFTREQVHVIGVVCDGIVDLPQSENERKQVLQKRCTVCSERLPVIYDTLVGEPQTSIDKIKSSITESNILELEQALPVERFEYWLSQFDRCIRCYACRQACPMCNCPTCLYERDDSLWVGMGIGINEKWTFHLGRAFHLAGRCVGCNECERACPMDIPISLLNQKLTAEIEKAFNHRAGVEVSPSPIVTILSGEYQES